VVSWPVIGQFSSIGSLGASADGWLRGEWLDSMSQVRGGRTPLVSSGKPHLQLVRPDLFHFSQLDRGYMYNKTFAKYLQKCFSVLKKCCKTFLHMFLHKPF